MEGQGQLTPEAQKREDEWFNTHGPKCPCARCMHVRCDWVEALDKAQIEIEALERQLEEERKTVKHATAVAARLGERIGQLEGAIRKMSQPGRN